MSKNQPKFTQEEFHQFFLYRGRAGPEGVYLFECMGNKDITLSSLYLKTNKCRMALPFHCKKIWSILGIVPSWEWTKGTLQRYNMLPNTQESLT